MYNVQSFRLYPRDGYHMRSMAPSVVLSCPTQHPIKLCTGLPGHTVSANSLHQHAGFPCVMPGQRLMMCHRYQRGQVDTAAHARVRWASVGAQVVS